MSEATKPFDPQEINLESVSNSFANKEALKVGIGHDKSLERVLFRLNHIKKQLLVRKEALKNGNLAELAPEIYATNYLMEDFISTMAEAITLCAVSAFRQEQGPISPPNAQASAGEDPPAPPESVDASAQEGGAEKVSDEN